MPLLTVLALLAIAAVGQAHSMAVPFHRGIVELISNNSVEFIRLSHNGIWQPPLKYIRNRTSPWQETELSTGYRQWTFPTFPSDSPTSVRCGRDSLSWASQTSTLKVKAGDKFEFVATTAPPIIWDDKTKIQWDGCPEGRGGCIPEDYDPTNNFYSFGVAHDGPASVFISRVPEGQNIESYDGSGEWLKISTSGVEFRDNFNWVYWLPSHGARLVAKLPPQTPAGKYLLRIDQIWPGGGDPSGGAGSDPQHYPACAHIEVESNSNSNPLPKGVKIPEVLCRECPGMTFGGNHATWLEALNGTVYPGGPIWDGETVKEDKVVPVTKDWYDPS
ncbi:glycosyl hydrolase family 61-domain-containing protein [Dendryphion nanum]|uniref:lytic cellulose monooxygenase (C4-dehydrogenating) n=1 Tax=Dendryphion nanum TaxID=256645 RepID=A0A9P9IJT0_9PLEO|nr:glycosyl hydrolase family 61-domain-containing protein [Dendryphion nanum]